jgi:hypothetical protein
MSSEPENAIPWGQYGEVRLTHGGKVTKAQLDVLHSLDKGLNQFWDGIATQFRLSYRTACHNDEKKPFASTLHEAKGPKSH